MKNVISIVSKIRSTTYLEFKYVFSAMWNKHKYVIEVATFFFYNETWPVVCALYYYFNLIHSDGGGYSLRVPGTFLAEVLAGEKAHWRHNALVAGEKSPGHQGSARFTPQCAQVYDNIINYKINNKIKQ